LIPAFDLRRGEGSVRVCHLHNRVGADVIHLGDAMFVVEGGPSLAAAHDVECGKRVATLRVVIGDFAAIKQPSDQPHERIRHDGRRSMRHI